MKKVARSDNFPKFAVGMEAKCRSVFFYRHYFEEFFERQNPKVKKKMKFAYGMPVTFSASSVSLMKARSL